MRVLAIDPGNEQSAYVVIDSETCRVLDRDLVNNTVLRLALVSGLIRYDVAAIEMIASYGMGVGQEVFDTCVWIGRFVECIYPDVDPIASLIKRIPVKMHHCHSAAAKDSNVIQALVDRFALGARNRGKGTTKEPGWFYGFKEDIWQAYALAVLIADMREGRA